MANRDQDLREAAVADMLESDGWEIARARMEVDLQGRKDFLAGSLTYDIEQVRLMQGEIKMLDALLHDPLEFFCPKS